MSTPILSNEELLIRRIARGEGLNAQSLVARYLPDTTSTSPQLPSGIGGLLESLLGEIKALRQENAALKESVAEVLPAVAEVSSLSHTLEGLAAAQREQREVLESLLRSDGMITSPPPLNRVSTSQGGFSSPVGPLLTLPAPAPAAGAIPAVPTTPVVPPVLPKPHPKDVRVWTGTWNMGCKSMFTNLDPTTNTPQLQSMFAEFLTNTYDIYVLGVQEAVDDDVFDALATVTGTVRLPLHAKLFPAREDAASEIRSRRMGRAINAHELVMDWQSGVGLEPVLTASDMLDRVLGHGDGAFTNLKFTGIAVFVKPAIAPYCRLLGVYKHSFGATEGSKGGVAAALGIFDVTVAFVTAHMASNKVEVRRAQYMELCERLGEKLGCHGFFLNEQFHHVVFMGDLNYRTLQLNAAQALQVLGSGLHQDMRQRFDELTQEMRESRVFYGYREPRMTDDFIPSYKVNENLSGFSFEDPQWPQRVYCVTYREPLYRLGRVSERVPAWTDRVLFHSLRDHQGELEPEPIDDHQDMYGAAMTGLNASDHFPVFAGFVIHCDTGAAQELKQLSERLAAAEVTGEASTDGAAATNGELVESKSADRLAMLPRVVLPGIDVSMPVNVVIRITDVVTEVRGQMRSPRAICVLFPLPFEDSDALPQRGKAVRLGGFSQMSSADKSSTILATVKSLVSSASRVPYLHLLLKVSMDNGVKAQCVVSMRAANLLPPGPSTTTLLEPLSVKGVPLVDRTGQPINVHFTAEIRCHKPTQTQLDSLKAQLSASATNAFRGQLGSSVLFGGRRGSAIKPLGLGVTASVAHMVVEEQQYAQAQPTAVMEEGGEDDSGDDEYAVPVNEEDVLDDFDDADPQQQAQPQQAGRHRQSSVSSSRSGYSAASGGMGSPSAATNGPRVAVLGTPTAAAVTAVATYTLPVSSMAATAYAPPTPFTSPVTSPAYAPEPAAVLPDRPVVVLSPAPAAFVQSTPTAAPAVATPTVVAVPVQAPAPAPAPTPVPVQAPAPAPAPVHTPSAAAAYAATPVQTPRGMPARAPIPSTGSAARTPAVRNVVIELSDSDDE